jgi:hypothetical protein
MKTTICIASALLVMACGGKQSGTNDDPCKDFDLDVQKVWNAEIKLKVDLAVKEIGGEAGVSEAEKVTTKMDTLTRDWVMLKESACQDHFKRQLITAEEYKQKAACFDAFLQQQRAVITALEGGDGAAIDKILEAQGELDPCK